MEKITILFTNLDTAGVFYYRTLTPAQQLQESYPDVFDIEINQNVNWNDEEYLKKFNIIHTHRQFTPKNQEAAFFNFARTNNIKLVLDIDDYWDLPKEHPMYTIAKMENLGKIITDTIRNVDAVTTTTKYFANIIKPFNKNVIDLNNGVNPQIMPQFNFCRADSYRTRFGLVLGSSHLADMELLSDMSQVFRSDNTLSNKASLGLYGFDLRGSMTNIDLNPELIVELVQMKLDVRLITQQLQKSQGDITKCSVPDSIKMKYIGQAFIQKTSDINVEGSVWYKYEQIITDKYKLIKDGEYLKYLQKYIDEEYDTENQPYVRGWTKGIHSYATHYDNVDVAMVPLVKNKDKNEFNACKSALKVCESIFKGCAMIVSDHPIYTEYVKHGVSGLVAKDSRDWIKCVKKLVANPELINEYANKLKEDNFDAFDLIKITEKRANFYLELMNK